jgi:hypothetical protein
MGQISISMTNWRFRFAILLAIAVLAVAAGILISTSTSQASSPHLSARAMAAEAACSSYLVQSTASESPSADPATIADAYPTTAGNLATWLLNFDPMDVPGAVQALSPAADVSACVLQGNWNLPSQSDTSSNVVNYEIVMVAPDGTSTPLTWGPSEIANAAPPVVGS